VSPVKRWFGRDRPAARPAAPLPPPAGAAELRTALGELMTRVKASSGHLPTEAVVGIRDIGDRLGQLLDHEERTGGSGSGPGSYELVTVAAVIRDYLPTSIDAYLALPPDFLDSHRSPEGETPAEELSTQLLVMEKGVTELAQAIYSGDAQRLSVQGRFLEAKFSSSDLDL
jgi:hypothetical protein